MHSCPAGSACAEGVALLNSIALTLRATTIPGDFHQWRTSVREIGQSRTAREFVSQLLLALPASANSYAIMWGLTGIGAIGPSRSWPLRLSTRLGLDAGPDLSRPSRQRSSTTSSLSSRST